MMIKRQFWKILLVSVLSVNDLYGKLEVVDRKEFSVTSFYWPDLFIDKDNRVFVEVSEQKDYLWINNNRIEIDQYGGFTNGFVKDGSVYLVFQKNEQYLDIYSVGKDFTLETHVTIGDFPKHPGPIRVIYVPGENDAFYLLSSRRQLSSNLNEALKFWMPGGRGIVYDKPVLAEIQGQTLLEDHKIPYGGKTDESYRIREVLTSKDTIHFLGFRTQEQFGERPNPSYPEVLHYAEYNVKKKKLIQSQDIYEKIPLKHIYWHVSADNFNDDLFVVFSWHGTRDASDVERNVVATNIENISTSIYYSQSDGNAFGNIEVIGQGILPLVRVDSLGNVHVIWANSDGSLVHKVKKDDKWGDEQIILVGVIDVSEVRECTRQGALWLQNMCTQFDKDNNLNVAFTSKGKLTYAKIRLD